MNPFPQMIASKIQASGVVFGVRLSKAGVDSWLRKTSSGRWELAELAEGSFYADAAGAGKVYSNMPRVALAALEDGATIELVRLEFAVQVSSRVIRPEPERQDSRGRCDCCDKKRIKVYNLKVYNLCAHCYEESCDSKNMPCGKAAKEKAAMEKVEA